MATLLVDVKRRLAEPKRKDTKKTETFISVLLHRVRDSNPRPSVLETDILPTKLTLCKAMVLCRYENTRIILVLPSRIELESNL